ncbi:MAG TPA: hypothetical protein VLF43_05180 [Candidatus Saccharimonadales bacterium]|nr:hypothetical protein [Candidatus Saccharimonadales bacterium]
MAHYWNKLSKLTQIIVVIMVLCVSGTGPFASSARAAEVQPRSLTMSNNHAGTTQVTYRLQFRYITGGTVGSIRLMFCADSAIVNTPCVPPVGFDASGVVIGTQLGAGGFSLDSSSTANEIVLGRPPAGVAAGTSGVYDFNLITNPDDPGPLYARVQTYATSDGTGPLTDNGGLALYYTNTLGVQVEVPPYLVFCVGESIVGQDCTTATEAFTDLGVLTSTTTSAAQSQMVIATNAENGYSMWAIGGTMVSGNNAIAAMTTLGPSTEGTPQFGLNLAANTDPVVGQVPNGPGVGVPVAGYFTPNQFKFVSGDVLATSPVPDDYRKYTASYIINIPSGQPGGVYSTTLTYITLANF